MASAEAEQDMGEAPSVDVPSWRRAADHIAAEGVAPWAFARRGWRDDRPARLRHAALGALGAAACGGLGFLALGPPGVAAAWVALGTWALAGAGERVAELSGGEVPGGATRLTVLAGLGAATFVALAGLGLAAAALPERAPQAVAPGLIAVVVLAAQVVGTWVLASSEVALRGAAPAPALGFGLARTPGKLAKGVAVLALLGWLRLGADREAGEAGLLPTACLVVFGGTLAMLVGGALGTPFRILLPTALGLPLAALSALAVAQAFFDLAAASWAVDYLAWRRDELA